jgi:GcrA cell cycle regulator
MNWTDERVELLKKLWGEGLSASQIAAQLGGVTRNAVIGKVHRLSLSGRAKPVSSTPPPRKVRALSPHRSAPRHYVSGNTALAPNSNPLPRRLPAPVPIENVVVPIPMNVPLLDLNEQTCRWPVGEPASDGFVFCGHKNWNSLPYCEYHSRLAYQPVERRRERRTEAY